MADAIYDAVVIGGGTKALITAMYLAKYGGMSVGIFERSYEAGGGWTTEESPAPGFLAECHATSTVPNYHMTVERDFPEWVELGGRYNDIEAGAAYIFIEDESTMILYSSTADPTFERTAKTIAKFSEKDAETWVKRIRPLRQRFFSALLEFLYNPAPPDGMPDALEKLFADPSSGFDPSWVQKTGLQVCEELFVDRRVTAAVLRISMAMGFYPDVPGYGYIAAFLPSGNRGVAGKWTTTGGTHQFAHAAVKILQAHGAKIFTMHVVDKVLIENGRATGIRLTDGTEIGARKLVLSGLDPYTLCFKLIGKEHIREEVLSKIANLERRRNCLSWYTFALHEPPNYRAAAYEPDVNNAMAVDILSVDPYEMVKDIDLIRQGKIPEVKSMRTLSPALIDKRRVPEGKAAAGVEHLTVPADTLTERQWLQYKRDYAEAVIKFWQKYAPNMTWDNVIGYAPYTPYDTAKRLPNMAPTGTWSVIDTIPSQFGRNRPIPELARHRTPIKNLYATGSAWHPYANASCWQGYNCYKIIAEDYGLEKPWEGQPF